MKPFKSLYDLLAEQSCISNKLFAELLVPVIRVILKTCKWRKLMLRQKWAEAITWVRWRGVYLSRVLSDRQVKEILWDSLNFWPLKSCGKFRPPIWLKFGITLHLKVWWGNELRNVSFCEHLLSRWIQWIGDSVV